MVQDNHINYDFNQITYIQKFQFMKKKKMNKQIGCQGLRVSNKTQIVKKKKKNLPEDTLFFAAKKVTFSLTKR